ncbi:MAG: CcoQ/FixQ family Cbb3-type cytochrome c oxidase assembly chaperone [Opitutaceae bacterium]|nr:CcoQ/FixQ family Cbb3-type cytochrome c oxidase assembly chaperone [Cytophagales bacterium]
MLKFIKQHVSSISGIEIYPLISFVLFFAFFIGVAIWVIKGNKQHFKDMSQIPLDNNETH